MEFVARIERHGGPPVLEEVHVRLEDQLILGHAGHALQGEEGMPHVIEDSEDQDEVEIRRSAPARDRARRWRDLRPSSRAPSAPARSRPSSPIPRPPTRRRLSRAHGRPLVAPLRKNRTRPRHRYRGRSCHQVSEAARSSRGSPRCRRGRGSRFRFRDRWCATT